MDARWSENAKYSFYSEVHTFLMAIIVPRTYYNSYKRISNEYLKGENVFLDTVNVSDLLK